MGMRGPEGKRLRVTTPRFQLWGHTGTMSMLHENKWRKRRKQTKMTPTRLVGGHPGGPPSGSTAKTRCGTGGGVVANPPPGDQAGPMAVVPIHRGRTVQGTFQQWTSRPILPGWAYQALSPLSFQWPHSRGFLCRMSCKLQQKSIRHIIFLLVQNQNLCTKTLCSFRFSSSLVIPIVDMSFLSPL